MIIEAARLAGRDLFARETRSAFWRILGITLMLLIGGWFAVREVFVAYALPWLQHLLPGFPEWLAWIGIVLGFIAGLGMAAAFILLIAPVTAIVAGLFLDGLAETIESRDYPHDSPGKAIPVGQAILYTVKFLGVVIVGNLVALLLLLIPGVNIVAFFLVNGYLFGREFFEFAALRFRSEDEVRQLRSKYAATIFLAGLLIAVVLSIPVVNLLTPLFGALLMVHLHKMIAHRDPEFALPA